MPKIKPERIAGIVALSYLALIPAGAFLVWRKIKLVEQDIDTLWQNSGMADAPHEPLFRDILKGFRR